MDEQTQLRDLLRGNTIAAADELSLDEGEGSVRCLACGHRCFIRKGKAGVCRVRFNDGGSLRVPGGYVAGLQIDPIEKKPFYHAYPGQNALSFGMLGCDLHCGYCQNWVTSQALRDDQAIATPRFCTAAELVGLAQRHRAPVVVSTYNEPLITADWSCTVFEKAREAGLACGFVSNGNATPEVLEYIRPFVSLYKVDLKGFRDSGYRTLGCTLGNVLKSIQRIKDMGFWLEIVTLVIPGFNDSEEELRDIARFVASISTDIPWHVTAYHPDYKMGGSRTQADTLIRAYDYGKEAGLNFVYPGNIAGAVGDREHTFCPDCGERIIERSGFTVRNNAMREGRCFACESVIPGVWEAQAPTRSVGTGRPIPLGL